MAEVQSHGNDFEDLIITELTGKTKKEYDSLKGKDGYTSGKPMRHKNIHTLLLCNRECWHELVYVKHRNTREIQHYSQYDEVSGIECEGDKLSKMYKSQEGRLPDY